MAQADFIAQPTLRVVQPKPKMTIYYALLIVALVAMMTACLFLGLEVRRLRREYGGPVPGGLSALERTDSVRCQSLHV